MFSLIAMLLLIVSAVCFGFSCDSEDKQDEKNTDGSCPLPAKTGNIPSHHGVKTLMDNLDAFEFGLAYVGNENGKYNSVYLSVPPADSKPLAETRPIRISKEQAAAIVKHFATSGFISQGIANAEKLLAIPPKPYAVMGISLRGMKFTCFAYNSWSAKRQHHGIAYPSLLDILKPFLAVLDGDAAIAIGNIVTQLENEPPLPAFYEGYDKDIKLLRKTFSLPKTKTKGSSGDAGMAAGRIFEKIEFVGMTKGQVFTLLGDPATISDYGIKAKPGPDEPLAYRFDSGRGGMQYDLKFKDWIVVSFKKHGLY